MPLNKIMFHEYFKLAFISDCLKMHLQWSFGRQRISGWNLFDVVSKTFDIFSRCVLLAKNQLL